MKIHKTQYVVTFGLTESGDPLPLLMWDGEPPEEMVQEAYRMLLPQEYEAGCPINWHFGPLLLPSRSEQ